MSQDLFDLLNDVGPRDVHSNERTIKGVIAWPGAKFRLAPMIVEHIPPCRIFVDVFGGAAAITLAYRGAKDLHVFNDGYGGLIDFYKSLIFNRKELIETLESFPNHSREWWEISKDKFCVEKDPVLRAAFWYYWINASVLGRGVSFGRQTKSKFIDPMSRLSKFNAVHSRMKTVQVENLDFRKCLKDFDTPETVFYLDPPYLGSDQTYQLKWSINDLKDLLYLVEHCKGTCLLSHSPHDLINDKGFWEEQYSWDIDKKSDVVAPHKPNITRKNTWTESLWVKHA